MSEMGAVSTLCLCSCTGTHLREFNSILIYPWISRGIREDCFKRNLVPEKCFTIHGRTANISGMGEARIKSTKFRFNAPESHKFPPFWCVACSAELELPLSIYHHYVHKEEKELKLKMIAYMNAKKKLN